MMKKLIYIFFLIFTITTAYSQTADVTKGCVPLLVNFTGPTPTPSTYYWDFGDGASSDFPNPSRQFIQS